jgi:hypothetical protein
MSAPLMNEEAGCRFRVQGEASLGSWRYGINDLGVAGSKPARLLKKARECRPCLKGPGARERRGSNEQRCDFLVAATTTLRETRGRSEASWPREAECYDRGR